MANDRSITELFSLAEAAADRRPDTPIAMAAAEIVTGTISCIGSNHT